MWEDPIVAEVHRIRDELSAAHNYDVKEMFADMRKRQAQRERLTIEANRVEADRNALSGPAPLDVAPAT